MDHKSRSELSTLTSSSIMLYTDNLNRKDNRHVCPGYHSMDSGKTIQLNSTNL